jgi:cation diffusion facilitator family transporter
VTVDTNADYRLGRRVAVAAIGASAILAVLNIVAGVLTESTSVFATGLEFAGDVLASTIVLLGMIVGGRPPDEDHPYGHGRVETLAGFTVGMLLVAGGSGISWSSLRSVGDIHAAPSIGAVGVLVIAIVVRGGMSTMKFRIGRRIGSMSLIADAWNDTVDILAALAALTAVGLSVYDASRFRAADHYGGFAVGIIVVLTGLRVLREASLELVDTMPHDDRIVRVRKVAESVPGVLGIEKSYARKTGFRYHVDLHIEVDPMATVEMGHAIAGHVRTKVKAELGWVADVLVHVEPAESGR